MITGFLFSPAGPAVADLIQFPITSNLKNTYHFMRAGESLLESQDIFSSNPLFLTNREDALSPLGLEQVQESCQILLSRDVNPSLVKFSLAAKSIDSANIVADKMLIGRDKLIPEYTFMDPRGVGKWDRRPISLVEDALFALDDMEAGDHGYDGRPPPNDDGTANETLGDQVTRLRELLSLCESHCSGDNILLIFADGTSPALLTSLITGFLINRVHELEYRSGEVRLNINQYTSIPLSIRSKEYLQRIRKGQENLDLLRNEEKEIALDEERQIALRKEFKDSRSERAILSRQAAKLKRMSTKSDRLVMPHFSLLLAPLALFLTTTSKSANYQPREDLFTIEVEPEIHDTVEFSDDDSNEEVSLHTLEQLVIHAPFTIPEMNDSDKEDRALKAREAMSEYMNRDDGSEAFIQLIVELSHEEY